MSGGNDGGGSWSSKFLKVAGAAAGAAAVAGGLYALMASSNSELEVPFGARGEHRKGDDRHHHESGWLKMKVDGSGKDSNGSPSDGDGCGGFLTDASGNWIIGFAQKLNPSGKSHRTEIKGILTGLQLASKMNVAIEKLIVKTDYKPAVSMVEDGVDPSHLDFDDIEHIRSLISDPKWKVKLVKIDEKANGVADKLAKYARTLSSYDLLEYHSPPYMCTQLLLQDQQGVSF